MTSSAVEKLQSGRAATERRSDLFRAVETTRKGAYARHETDGGKGPEKEERKKVVEKENEKGGTEAQ
ncbi:thylakoid lumenal 17.9 kDa protein, chloroplastic-like [Sesbania bispinosa]|nr:thylakoid lumenal 17.9 kDa protein, chloroplastic-like [Sesbania bispinosa]